MDHPFIIQLHATYKDKGCLYMVTELVLGGELFSVLTREEYLVRPPPSGALDTPQPRRRVRIDRHMLDQPWP